MKNKVSKYPGRVFVTPEDGSPSFYATITRADEPIEEGTPLNKATLLTDETAALYGLNEDATVNDALKAVHNIFARPVLKVTTLPNAVASVVKGTDEMEYTVEHRDDHDYWTFTLKTLGDYTLNVTWGEDIGSTDITFDEVAVKEYDAIALPHKSTFSSNSWGLIGEMCKRKLVPSTWKVGDTKKLTLSDGYTYDVRIVHKGGVPYADTSRGDAPVVFEFVQTLPKAYTIDSWALADFHWSTMSLRTKAMQEILELLPNVIKTYISPVTLTSNVPKNGSDLTETTEDTLFILNSKNYNASVVLTSEDVYDYYASDSTVASADSRRVKQKIDTGSAVAYATRTTLYEMYSGSQTTWLHTIKTDGSLNGHDHTTSGKYLAPAFCF